MGETATGLEIRLTAEVRRRLTEKAERLGLGLTDYVQQLVERAIFQSERTFDEILAPLRTEVTESGFGAPDVDRLLDEALQDSRTARNRELPQQ